MSHETLRNNIETFCQHIDNAYQVEFVRRYEQIGDSRIYGGKYCGSDAEHAGADFIAEELRKMGVPDVEVVETPTTRYQFNDASIDVISPAAEKLEINPYGYVSPGTDPEGITAELIDGAFSSREFYDTHGEDAAEGKIVMLEGMGVLEGTNLAGQMEEAINHGARAILIYMTEDVLDEDTIRVQPPNLTATVPILGISIRHATYLKELLAQGPVTIRLTVDAEFDPAGGVSRSVIGTIPGTMTEEYISFSAHQDHYFRCLQDNMASCATLLGIAKAIMDYGYQPNRNILFVFHASHECGLSDSRYAYISGSYKLTRSKPEWKRRVLTDINFEYAALALEKLGVITTLGTDASVLGYLPYAPALMGGYQTISPEIDRSLYYMMSWCDGISWHTNGTPVITNDVITEQMTTGNSPYVGRDHSNMDNWDSFSPQALEDTTRFYGGYGLYLDAMPYLEQNFSQQARRAEEELNMDVIREAGLDTADYQKQLARIDTLGQELLQRLKTANDAAEDPGKEAFGQAVPVNAEVLGIYDLLQGGMEKIIAEDFLNVGSGRYSANIALLQGAIQALEEKNPEKALKEYLLAVDLCAASYHFSPEVVEHMRKQIADPEYADRRIWARGKELHCLKLYDTVQHLKQMAAGNGRADDDFATQIAQIKEAIAEEETELRKVFAQECECLRTACDRLEHLMAMMA